MKKLALLLCLLMICTLLCACGEKEITLLALVDADLSTAEASAVGTKINQLPEVKKTEFITQEEALAEFVGQHEDASSFAGISATDMRHRFRITVVTSDVDAMVEKLEAIEGIEAVSNPSDYRFLMKMVLWFQQFIPNE